MAKGKYIKVTLHDKTEHVVLAANEAFYKKQGTKVSEPTTEEIYTAFPEEKKEPETKKTVKEPKEKKEPETN